MTDLQAICELFYKNEIDFRKTVLYNDDNRICGEAIWLEKIGHIEFDKDENLKNIVIY